MDIPKELAETVESTPDTLHGAIRFRGTRVFAQQLFDYILGGDSLEDFLEDFPEVSRESAHTLLSWEREQVKAKLDPRLSA